ncbi:hypothetical protein [Pedobacter sp. UYP1]|uniref:hypothetical protein n=1 Tax=Pedobacter sp. UYP1 TaxID=1756396 RepID=UPI0033978F38
MNEDLKLFTDQYGKFQMLTPIGFQYKNPGMDRTPSEPHAFGGYIVDMGAFQVSCKPVNEQISNLMVANKLPIHKCGEELKFHERLFEIGDMVSYIWMAVIEDHFLLSTYIYKKDFAEQAEQQLENVRGCLRSIKYIKPKDRDRLLAERRYVMFMSAIAAAIDLRNKALENGSFIEIIILTANRIDALLRLAIMLTNQLKDQNDEIDVPLLFQDEQDKVIMERRIYQMALDQKIVDHGLFDRLELLYKERNKVVHRYIITDLRTEDVIRIVFEYYDVEEAIDGIVNALEL